jgi:hypothetical protein
MHNFCFFHAVRERNNCVRLATLEKANFISTKIGQIEYELSGPNLPVVRLGYRTPATFQNGFHVGLSVNLR